MKEDLKKIDQMIVDLKEISDDNIVSEKFYEIVELAKKILELSQKLDYSTGKIEADNILGKAYFHICDYQNS
ncbi:MAG: hypothetical protein KAS62_10070, partial [Candidatus Delongbacteria bacterium]|nr:hypothetical protein [Candidatus Delongbacteria bacterium]